VYSIEKTLYCLPHMLLTDPTCTYPCRTALPRSVTKTSLREHNGSSCNSIHFFNMFSHLHMAYITINPLPSDYGIGCHCYCSTGRLRVARRYLYKKLILDGIEVTHKDLKPCILATSICSLYPPLTISVESQLEGFAYLHY
jgi:hypothetical protein